MGVKLYSHTLKVPNGKGVEPFAEIGSAWLVIHANAPVQTKF